MAPTKRARPAFSPPRPGRPKPSTITKSATSSTNGRKSRKSDTPKPSKPSKSKTPTTEPRRRSRLVSPTPSASDSQGEVSQNDGIPDHDHDHDTNSQSPDLDPDSNINVNIPTSPEPDFILAEVTTTSTLSPSDQVIPLPLLHRILQSHFHHPDTTKISTDAREVAGRYIDVFVREAIMRCAYEKNGKSQNGTENGDGWLEVEDLEKGAVQLCLDF